MFEVWDEISRLDEIDNLREAMSNEDGEGANFELKRCSSKFENDDKKRISKEICAFSNTYGGLLCIHADEVEGRLISFDDCLELEKRIESWLPHATEPPIRGMKIKTVDGVILIAIPESETKPHRTKLNRDYYYRSNSASEPMPEIMISSLYRSGSSLQFESFLSFGMAGNGQPHISLTLLNKSRASGTMPTCAISIWTRMSEWTIGPAPETDLEFSHSDYRLRYGFGPLNWTHLGVSRTKKSWRNEILYPEGVLGLEALYNEPKYDIWENNFFAISSTVCFIECPPVNQMYVFFNNEGPNFECRESGSTLEIAPKLKQYFPVIADSFID